MSKMSNTTYDKPLNTRRRRRNDRVATRAETEIVELIARCMSGDEESWMSFVRQWAPLIVAVIKNTLLSFNVDMHTEIVEDLRQEVFVKLMQHDCRAIASYQPARGEFRPYLAAITRNRVISYLRRCPRNEVPLDEETSLAVAPTSHREELGILKAIFTPRQVHVLTLLYRKGWSAGEVAESLGTSRQTVYDLKYEAKRKLRRVVAGDFV